MCVVVVVVGEGGTCSVCCGCVSHGHDRVPN